MGLYIYFFFFLFIFLFFFYPYLKCFFDAARKAKITLNSVCSLFWCGRKYVQELFLPFICLIFAADFFLITIQGLSDVRFGTEYGSQEASLLTVFF